MQQLCPSSRLREGSHAKGSGGSFRVLHSHPEDGRCPRTGAVFSVSQRNRSRYSSQNDRCVYYKAVTDGSVIHPSQGPPESPWLFYFRGKQFPSADGRISLWDLFDFV